MAAADMAVTSATCSQRRSADATSRATKSARTASALNKAMGRAMLMPQRPEPYPDNQR